MTKEELIRLISEDQDVAQAILSHILRHREQVGEMNVQSDWNVDDPTSDAHILNKPTIPTS